MICLGRLTQTETWPILSKRRLKLSPKKEISPTRRPRNGRINTRGRQSNPLKSLRKSSAKTYLMMLTNIRVNAPEKVSLKRTKMKSRGLKPNSS